MSQVNREVLLREWAMLRQAQDNLKGLIHAVNVQMEAIAFQPENWESYMYSWLDRNDWINSLHRVERRMGEMMEKYPEILRQNTPM